MAHYDEFRGCKVIPAKQGTVAFFVGGFYRQTYEREIYLYDSKGIVTYSGDLIPWRRVKKVRVYG